jgi:hypothetical protein
MSSERSSDWRESNGLVGIVRAQNPIERFLESGEARVKVSVMPKSKPLTFVTDAVVLLTKDQARKLVDRINLHFNDARTLLLELQEREGWKALGYESWRACAIAEFGQSQSRVYQLLDAARVERNISTVVEQPGQIPETVLRPIVSMEPEDQRASYQEAQKEAKGGRVTVTHIKAGKQTVLTAKKARLTKRERLADAWLVVDQTFGIGTKFEKWGREHLTDEDALEMHGLPEPDRTTVRNSMLKGRTFQDSVKALSGISVICS